MASLYSIQNDILRIFDEVEENYGEITEEQEKELSIKREELEDKLDAYYKAIKSWEGDIDSCKAEEKRIKAVRDKYENRIKRLKDNMLYAVQEFGQDGKNNKFIELPTVRIFTKQSTSVDINTERINILITEFNRYIHELVNQGCLYTGEDVDLQGILECINANCRAEYGEDFELFTVHDLISVKLEFAVSKSIYDLFTSNNGGLVINNYINNENDGEIKLNVSKSELKDTIEVVNKMNKKITVASIVKNDNLQMR